MQQGITVGKIHLRTGLHHGHIGGEFAILLFNRDRARRAWRHAGSRLGHGRDHGIDHGKPCKVIDADREGGADCWHCGEADEGRDEIASTPPNPTPFDYHSTERHFVSVAFIEDPR